MQFKLFVFLVLTTLGAAAEDACPPTEVVKFAELYANPHLHSCQKNSDGFSMAPPTGYPTDSQLAAMCDSDACHALMDDVFAMKPTNCYLSFSGMKLNAYKIACSFKSACKSDTEKCHEDETHPPTSEAPKDATWETTEDEQKHSNHEPSEQDLTPKPFYKDEEPKIEHCEMDSAIIEAAKVAHDLQTSMNDTALEFSPTPATTYKATEAPKV
ncbi:hypothetical protein CCR75_000939 [Bremia lactucae]|uniref:Elicitin-like protein n=1 Tax=Bremia lactucae TaxID=4779 RepID=A0A976IEC4_BRELC|nr:hypothetical protein CCR75_000939 [Bremia lactucae]